MEGCHGVRTRFFYIISVPIGFQREYVVLSCLSAEGRGYVETSAYGFGYSLRDLRAPQEPAGVSRRFVRGGYRIRDSNRRVAFALEFGYEIIYNAEIQTVPGKT